MSKHKARGFLKPYGTYVFKTKDPVIDELRTLKADANMKDKHISALSGVSTGTLGNWWGPNGGTKRPQNASVEAVGRAIGKKRAWVNLSEKDREGFSPKAKKALSSNTQR